MKAKAFKCLHKWLNCWRIKIQEWWKPSMPAPDYIRIRTDWLLQKLLQNPAIFHEVRPKTKKQKSRKP